LYTGTAPLLEIQGLKTCFPTKKGVINAVNDVSLTVRKGEVLGLVGESGSGKSTIGLSIMRLLPPPGRIIGGKILFEGEDLVTASDEKMRNIRGPKISTVFQDPMTSLNPVFPVGFQITESLRLHENKTKEEAKRKAISVLKMVGIPEPERRFRQYPHEFSGGMRQRAMIAIAICCSPQLVIADEPTTSLDVTVQAQILDLLRELKQKLGMSVILISHNLGVVAELANNVAVAYAGKIIEYSDAKSVFESPKHPYTQGLLASTPNLAKPKTERLHAIRGAVPYMLALPPGCPFHPRCEKKFERCPVEEPVPTKINGGYVRCHLYG
jgi:peptide/nickel transport system ATP-binding protein